VDWVFDYNVMHLNNSGDDLIITMGSTVIDELSYVPPIWPVTEGISMYLDPNFLDAELNDSEVPWCVTPFEAAYDYPGAGVGDYGTPGTANPSGLCCHDDDGDGWDVCEGDCDDDDASRFPENPELADLVDNDCDLLVDEDYVVEGMVVVTEIMDDPYAVDMDRGEWIELYNAGDIDLNLYGWRVADALGDGFLIDVDLIIEAGSYAVFAVDADPDRNGGVDPVDFSYDYDSFPLDSFTDDDVQLLLGDLTVSTLSYSNDPPWPSASGRSSFLCPGLEADGGSSEADDWGLTPTEADFDYGAGDYGTPGVANVAADTDGDGTGACDGDCDDSDPAIGPDATELCDNNIDDDCDGAVDDDDPDCGGVVDTDDETGEPPTDDTSSTDDTGEGDGKDGCEGCASGRSSASPWLMLLALAGLAVRRRRSLR
jgi:MYXO-CTERM domain-containing protein